MRLVTLPGKIVANAGHTLIIMADGHVRQAVCVLADAIQSGMRREHESINRYLGIIEHIASRKAERGEIAFDGRVWITASDISGSDDDIIDIIH